MHTVYLPTATDATNYHVENIFRYVDTIIRFPAFSQGAIDSIGPDKNRIVQQSLKKTWHLITLISFLNCSYHAIQSSVCAVFFIYDHLLGPFY